MEGGGLNFFFRCRNVHQACFLAQYIRHFVLFVPGTDRVGPSEAQTVLCLLVFVAPRLGNNICVEFLAPIKLHAPKALLKSGTGIGQGSFNVRIANLGRVRSGSVFRHEQGAQTQTFESGHFGGLPREGVGAKSLVCPSKPRKTKLFGGISQDFWRDIPEV